MPLAVCVCDLLGVVLVRVVQYCVACRQARSRMFIALYPLHMLQIVVFHLDSALVYVTNVYGQTVLLVVNFHVRVAFELHSHIPSPSRHMLLGLNMIYNTGTL